MGGAARPAAGTGARQQGSLTLARLRRMLPVTAPEGAALERFLPETAAGGPDAALRRRAALASTLLAGLEIEREGGAALAQDEAFGPVRIAPS
jgi:segregation and condensation protein A